MKPSAFLLMLACATVQAQETVSFPTPAKINPVAAIEGRLSRPKGDGPFPAVVLMHGCSGPTAGVANWASFFVDKGYVALEVFGFRPRGIDEVCTKPPAQQGITLRDRAADAFGALAYLQSQAYVDGRRVALMGFSHGGSTTLTAASGSFPRPDPGKPDFAAALPFYPGCFDFDLDSAVPMLIVTGEADDWTPSKPCERKAERAKAAGHDVKIAVMPGAHHAFDSPTIGGVYRGNVRNGSKPGGCCGATIAGSVSARQQSEREVLAFLGAGLKPAADQPAEPRIPAAPADDAVVAFVKRAAALQRDGGEAKLIAAVNEHGGSFEAIRFHVMVFDGNGRWLAHARYPAALGTSSAALKDREGRPVWDRVQAALAAGGWGDYATATTSYRFYAERAGTQVIVGLKY